jgi:hypothetical protein
MLCKCAVSGVSPCSRFVTTKAKNRNLNAALPKVNRVHNTRTATTGVQEPEEPMETLANIYVDSGLADCEM